MSRQDKYNILAIISTIGILTWMATDYFRNFGYDQVYHGKYKFHGDTIVFSKKPYDNEFIPDTILIDRQQNAIFLYKDDEGNFSNTKKWLNHFEIR